MAAVMTEHSAVREREEEGEEHKMSAADQEDERGEHQAVEREARQRVSRDRMQASPCSVGVVTRVRGAPSMRWRTGSSSSCCERTQEGDLRCPHG